MPTWFDLLQAGRVVVIDGGTGTELRRRGVELDRKTWSALAGFDHPDALTQVHADYIAAGADIITTNTFGTSRFVLEAAGHGGKVAEINRAAIDAAEEARARSGGNVAIAGSMSCLPPRFDSNAYPDPSTEASAYAEQAELFATGGADLIALEMMQDEYHARLACEAARSVGLPFWLGVSCRLAANGDLVAYDYPETPLVRVLDALLPYEPTVVNVMHTPAHAVTRALVEIRRYWRGFLGVYPANEPKWQAATPHGQPDAVNGAEPRAQPRDAPLDADEFAAIASRWIAAGAGLVGGCCGTTPEHVRALRACVDEHERETEARR
jgi:homocysteine S-methyltransferase